MILLSFPSYCFELKQQLQKIEQQIGGRLGVAVLNTETNKLWAYNGDQRFPLLSTFKALACAKMLSDIDSGALERDSKTLITQEHLVVWSPITTKSVNSHITVLKACEAAMLISDNAAANIVLDNIGGPKGLTQYLRVLGDETTRLDRIEPDINTALEGDERDTTSPKAMVLTMNRLLYGNELNAESKTQLTSWMVRNKISGSLLRSVLPSKWHIADRSGAGKNGSRAIVASVWRPNTKPYVIAIYLTGKKMGMSDRNKIIAEVGRNVFRHFSIK